MINGTRSSHAYLQPRRRQGGGGLKHSRSTHAFTKETNGHEEITARSFMRLRACSPIISNACHRSKRLLSNPETVSLAYEDTVATLQRTRLLYAINRFANNCVDDKRQTYDWDMPAKVRITLSMPGKVYTLHSTLLRSGLTALSEIYIYISFYCYVRTFAINLKIKHLKRNKNKTRRSTHAIKKVIEESD